MPYAIPLTGGASPSRFLVNFCIGRAFFSRNPFFCLLFCFYFRLSGSLSAFPFICSSVFFPASFLIGLLVNRASNLLAATGRRPGVAYGIGWLQPLASMFIPTLFPNALNDSKQTWTVSQIKPEAPLLVVPLRL